MRRTTDIGHSKYYFDTDRNQPLRRVDDKPPFPPIEEAPPRRLSPIADAANAVREKNARNAATEHAAIQPAGDAVAYAIYGIINGKHRIKDVRQIEPGQEWTCDDASLGEYWAGNEPLFFAAPVCTPVQAAPDAVKIPPVCKPSDAPEDAEVDPHSYAEGFNRCREAMMLAPAVQAAPVEQTDASARNAAQPIDDPITLTDYEIGEACSAVYKSDFPDRPGLYDIAIARRVIEALDKKRALS